MVAARGGDEAYVHAYVERVWESLNGQTAPLDQFKFWRARWDQDHARPTGPREVQYKRAWECRSCGKIHDGTEAQYRAHWCPHTAVAS
jgi:rubrerythrin